jgi:hypothetical protein
MEIERDTSNLADLDRATLRALIEAELVQDPDNEFLWDILLQEAA